MHLCESDVATPAEHVPNHNGEGPEAENEVLQSEESKSPDLPDWMRFLFKLGCHLETLRRKGHHPSAVIVLPAIEFSSLLLAGGVVFEQVNQGQNALCSGSAQRFRELIGTKVKFPRLIKGQTRQLTGVLERIEGPVGEEYLVIKYHEGNKQNRLNCWAHVREAEFALVSSTQETVDLASQQRGEQLAVGISAVQQLLGSKGASELLGRKANGCWIIDSKSRLMKELEEPVSLARLSDVEYEKSGQLLQMRDLIRPDLQQWPAVAESARSHIDKSPPKCVSWTSTVIVGTLPFVRFFELVTSPIRIAVISPTMTAYDEAISWARQLFQRRAEHELLIPGELLQAKPASFDIQLWEAS